MFETQRLEYRFPGLFIDLVRQQDSACQPFRHETGCAPDLSVLDQLVKAPKDLLVVEFTSGKGFGFTTPNRLISKS